MLVTAFLLYFYSTYRSGRGYAGFFDDTGIGTAKVYGVEVERNKKTMNTRKDFPKWLYDYIFVQLGAKERPDPNEFKLNLESGVDKNIDYLGTYFPRSYA